VRDVICTRSMHVKIASKGMYSVHKFKALVSRYTTTVTYLWPPDRANSLVSERVQRMSIVNQL
jgi:hypothetical protein